MLNDNELDRLRSDQEAWMPDTLTVTRPAGTQTLDTATLVSTAAAATAVWSGSGRVMAQTGAGPTGEAEAVETLRRYWVTVPWDADPIQVGDTVTVTASAHDPDLAGRALRVVDISHSAYLTARRLVCHDRLD